MLIYIATTTLDKKLQKNLTRYWKNLTSKDLYLLNCKAFCAKNYISRDVFLSFKFFLLPNQFHIADEEFESSKYDVCDLIPT